MPLTPFHLGPALFFGLLFFSFIDLPTFIVANVILDIEPFIVLLLGVDQPLHGFFHSFLGGSVAAVFLAFLMEKASPNAQPLMSFFRLGQKSSRRSIWAASFFGVYLHIILDSLLYTDIRPFYPLDFNPFYNNSMFAGFEVYLFCVIAFVLGFVLYVFMLLKDRGKT
ncbi:MAG: metal-dependent hydrolase [Candidatus Altiarchaeota archaeon]|nr:metal-dependent hydrolase [Candidatus Altiarchaeota archaeon]